MRSEHQQPSEGVAPSATADRLLIRVGLEAYVATAHLKPRDRARAFIDKIAEILRDEDAVAELLPSRSSAEHVEIARAHRLAVAIFREYMPTLNARVPPDI